MKYKHLQKKIFLVQKYKLMRILQILISFISFCLNHSIDNIGAPQESFFAIYLLFIIILYLMFTQNKKCFEIYLRLTFFLISFLSLLFLLPLDLRDPFMVHSSSESESSCLRYFLFLLFSNSDNKISSWASIKKNTY